MNFQANTPEEYIAQIPEERKEAVRKLREIMLNYLPEGFEESINYGMIGYVVPHTIYPRGYHVNPELSLPFIHIASQKSHIALYHSGLYASKNLMDWFIKEYPKHSTKKPDMGKSCLRFKKPEHIPYDLISELATKMTPKEWIDLYESTIKRR